MGEVVFHGLGDEGEHVAHWFLSRRATASVGQGRLRLVIRHCLPDRSSAERAFNVECRSGKQWHVSRWIGTLSLVEIPVIITTVANDQSLKQGHPAIRFASDPATHHEFELRNRA